ncbi:MAG: response regulator [Alphaproteobacteria bacterium]|nr:response regulator [Alphaproteobacteria bacterium]
MDTSAPILIIEDDRNIADLVRRYLERAGYESLVAHDGAEGLAMAQSHKPRFVILDVMLPGMDGWEVCRALRKVSEIPILILTARAEEMDRVVGLSIGADDYVVKPFSPRELVERVKAILRRAGPAAANPTSVMEHNGLMVDVEKRRVTVDGTLVALTPSEFTLLEALMTSPGRVYTRADLLNRLYAGGESVVDRVVDVHIGKLRRKIETESSRPRYIETVHGIGYRFADSDIAP